jgi:hypothetical protein
VLASAVAETGEALMNVRWAIAVVAAGVLLAIGTTAAPAYAEDVDLKALPATASGNPGATVAVTIVYEASAAISGSPPVVQLDVTFPAGVPIKDYPSPCKYWGSFKARCLLDSVQPGRHELLFQVIMSTLSVSTGSFTLMIKAPGYTEPTLRNNTASITLKRTAAASSSPSAASSVRASAKPTPKPSKRSGMPSATPTETDQVAPTEEAPVDGPSATSVAVTTAADEDSSSLPVLILGGAGVLVVVGGLLLWVILRRRSDDEDEEYDEYDRYR